MSWTKSTIRRGKDKFLIATETLTVATSDSNGQDLTSSEIDFIPAGVDFTVISNYDATDLSSDADTAVKAAYESGGTYALLKDDLETTIDDATKASFYDVSANGEAPFYKLFIDSDGVQKKTDTVDMVVVVPIT